MGEKNNSRTGCSPLSSGINDSGNSLRSRFPGCCSTRILLFLKASLIILPALFPLRTLAITLFEFRGMNQYALGSAITVPYSPGVASREKTSGALFLKAGEIRLFQLPDLKIDLVGLSLRKKSSLLSIIFSSLSSPLGGEKLASLLWQNAKWEKSAFEVGFNLYVQDLKGMKRETLLGASFGMFLPVTKSLAMGYRVRNIAIFGEEHRGADVSVFIGITALSGVHGYPVLSLRRNQEIGFGFAGSMALLAGRAGLAFGYDDSTGELRAALTLQVRSVQISTGAGLHPVLGISEGLTVTWGL